MCLTIDNIKHSDLKPIRLDKDLVVSKSLLGPNLKILWPCDPWWLKSICNFITPCQYKPIHFLFGKCILRAKLDKPQESKYYRNGFIINKGIHSHFRKYTDLYPAIIPKGTLVYYGIDGDIVAEKLIIYKDKKKWQQLK